MRRFGLTALGGGISLLMGCAGVSERGRSFFRSCRRSSAALAPRLKRQRRTFERNGALRYVCVAGKDGVRRSLTFEALLGEDRGSRFSFAIATSRQSQNVRDVLSFPAWVKDSHFEPAGGGQQRTGCMGFSSWGRQKCLPGAGRGPNGTVRTGRFYLAPQPWRDGSRLEGATTRLLRCDSDKNYRL